MIDIHTIFDKLDGPSAVARVLNIKPSTANEMKRRKTIPVKYWPRIVAQCKARRVRGVNYTTLVNLHQGNSHEQS